MDALKSLGPRLMPFLQKMMSRMMTKSIYKMFYCNWGNEVNEENKEWADHENNGWVDYEKYEDEQKWNGWVDYEENKDFLDLYFPYHKHGDLFDYVEKKIIL